METRSASPDQATRGEDPASAGARVASVYLSPRRREPMQSVASARAVAGFGLEGDAHARPGTDRQMLLIDLETLDEMRIPAGALKENVTTTGLGLQSQPMGRLLRVGGALLRLTQPCPPCHLVDEVRPGLQRHMVGRRGVLAEVVETGEIRVGDPIALA